MAIRKAPKQSKPIVLAFTAVSGLTLGVLLGVFYLLSLPVAKVSKGPSQAELSEPGNFTSYFQLGLTEKGETANLRSGVSRIKGRAPGPLSFSEGEVNYYLAQLAEELGGEDSKSEPKESRRAKLDKLNVHLDGNQMLASFRIVINPDSDPFEMRVVANIGFENTDAGPELQVKGLKLNSLPVPVLGGVAASMIQGKIAELGLPDELQKMWKNIKVLDVQSSQLVAEVGLRRSA